MAWLVLMASQGLYLHSTRTPDFHVSLSEAVLRSLAPDGGLYMPDQVAQLSPEFWANWRSMSFAAMATEIAATLFQGAVPRAALEKMCQDALDFPVPLVEVSPNLRVLELFHGPTLAFKDFGARLMSRLMAYFAQSEGRGLTILAATSGDTGGAVASAFHNVAGTRVVILYPSGRVSPLQEKQLTTLGGNVTAIEVEGSFDDCQRMVKAAFMEPELTALCGLSSANSINIARLVPQMFYYFEAARQLPEGQLPTFVVPSGNFGNLTAGLFAVAMGLKAAHFVAATNANDTVPNYLAVGDYVPKPSVATLSNAMDVGAPSNFERMLALHGHSHEAMCAQITGLVVDDATTHATMDAVWTNHGYQLDPHTAVGWHAATTWLRTHPEAHPVVLATAHPAKFLEVSEEIFGAGAVVVPERLARLAELPKWAIRMPADNAAFTAWLATQAQTWAK